MVSALSLAYVASLQQALASAPLALQVLAALGGLLVARVALETLTAVYTFFLRPAKSVTTFGKWGIVTGATDGIGKALAMELARKGMNVVLMSRTQRRLEEVRDEILATYTNVAVKVLAVDFNNVHEAAVRRSIEDVITDVQDVGVLFNNVGVSYDFPEYFAELPDDRLRSLITLNVTAGTIMVKLVLPGMVARKRGAIVNVSSGSARLTVPLLAEYSAAKRYVEQFSHCLAHEYKATNVHIQCHTPMFVSTKLAKIRHTSFTVPSPTTYARASVAMLGHRTLVSPYWPHALQIWLFECVPATFFGKLAMASHLSLRKRALKKLPAKKTE